MRSIVSPRQGGHCTLRANGGPSDSLFVNSALLLSICFGLSRKRVIPGDIRSRVAVERQETRFIAGFEGADRPPWKDAGCRCSNPEHEQFLVGEDIQRLQRLDFVPCRLKLAV